MNRTLELTLSFLFAVSMFGLTFRDRLPYLFYDRYEYPMPITSEDIRNLSDEGYERYEWYESGYDRIEYDKKIISGDDADVLTYISEDRYSLMTFFEHDFWIDFELLRMKGFRLIQFQNTKGLIDQIYFAPDEG